MATRNPDTFGWLGGALVAIVAVVCCAGPLLLAALALSGAGAWLVAHGYTLGAAALIGLAALFVSRITARMSRQ